MEVAGPLGTPLGLAQRKRASPRGEAYLISGCVGSSLLHGLSLVSESGDYSLVAVCGLLMAVASLNVEYRL